MPNPLSHTSQGSRKILIKMDLFIYLCIYVFTYLFILGEKFLLTLDPHSQIPKPCLIKNILHIKKMLLNRECTCELKGSSSPLPLYTD